MDSVAWAAYFERNQHRAPAFVPGEIAPAAPVDPELMAAIVRSLQRFHLGETCEGRIVHEAEESADPALDASVRRALAGHVREEGRHAREIALLLASLGSRTSRRHWSDGVFRRARRLLGLRTKLLAIAAAEISGIVFYGLLRDLGPTPGIRRLGEVIAQDEEGHLAFLAEWLIHAARTSRRRRLAEARLAAEAAVLASAATAVFVADHGPLIRALGLRRREVAARCAAVAAEVVRRARRGEGPREIRGAEGREAA